MKLLPFPWIFATRKLARRLIERNESLTRIIETQGDELDRLRRIAGEDRYPRRPACPACGRPGQPEIPRFATGGILQGYGPGDDSVPAILSHGGPLVSKEHAEAMGLRADWLRMHPETEVARVTDGIETRRE